MSNNVSFLKLKKPSHPILEFFDASGVNPETAAMPFRKKPYQSVSDVFDASVSSPSSAGTAPFKLKARRVLAAEKPQLDNRGATFPEDGTTSKELRGFVSSRWKLKREVVVLLRKNPKDDGSTYAVCGCGYAGVNKNEHGDLLNYDKIEIHRQGKRVSVSGALRCNSPWMCPSCAPARAKKRREKIEQVIRNTIAKKGIVAFVTLTIGHKKGEALEILKGIQSEASRRSRQGRFWQDLKKAAGILGVVQGFEVLENVRTGWHFHSHLLVPCFGSVDEVKLAMKQLVAKYISIVKELGGKASQQGQDIQIIDENAVACGADNDLSVYVAKGSASWEVAGSLKDARSAKSRTPWDLAKLASAGDEEAESLFVEYANNMVGVRSCVVSASLAKQLEIDASEDDDEIQDTEVAEKSDELENEEEEVFILSIKSERWKKLMSHGYAHRVLESVESGLEVEACDDIVCGFLDEIKLREREIERANNIRKTEAKTEYVSSFDVLYYVIEYRRLGMSVSQAKIKAIKYLKEFHRKSGRVVVMPMEADIDKVILMSQSPDSRPN